MGCSKMVSEAEADALAQFVKRLLMSTDQTHFALSCGYDEKPNFETQYMVCNPNNTWTIHLEVNGGAQIRKLDADGVVREVVKVLKRGVSL